MFKKKKNKATPTKILLPVARPTPFSRETFFFAQHTSFVPVSCLVPCCCNLGHVITDHWLIHVWPGLTSWLPATLEHDKSIIWNAGCATLLFSIWWVLSTSHGQNFKGQKNFWTDLPTLSSSSLATGNRKYFWCSLKFYFVPNLGLVAISNFV